ncbi:MAG: peptidoglycan-binding protein [Acidobacteriaceae bacterium]|nr:peptidoglycan-binding protein [Acidobacteriaceae bacterium]
MDIFRWARVSFLFLLSAGSPAQSNLSVCDAVHKGHAVGHEQDGLKAVREALAAGGDVNEQDHAGWTPIMHAALECRAQILDLLLERGALVNVRSATTNQGFMTTGRTPLLVAAGCFISRRRAQLAPERGMPPGYIEYELAAAEKMVHDLLAHGADVTTTDIGGRTPLMMAVMHRWPGAVRDLIAAHADVNARDREGRLAIDYADRNDRETIAALKEAGSKGPTGHSGRIACDVEVALNKLGSDFIQDCISDGDLARAAKEFQESHGLSPSGLLDPATLKTLGVRP